ncbi:hypothetical protein MMC26_001700 [Xylographa opegraphella]|nr:hypothetical protein [Xylographa opegraphella]
MSSQAAQLQHFQQLLNEANLRADKAEAARREAVLRAEEEHKRTQQTTFEEFLEACHEHLHGPLVVETDKRLTTRGFTNPSNKYFPKTLRQWEEFPQLQQDTFDSVYKCLHPPNGPAPRLFSPIISLQDTGRKICRRSLASEQDLEHYERVAVEDMVSDVISQMTNGKDAQQGLQLGQGIIFDNHANSLSDTAEEVRERLHIQTPQTSPQSSRSSSFSSSNSGSSIDSKLVRPYADQFCVYKNMDGLRQLLFIVEYKPPHKLLVGNIRAGFREMNVKEEVIERITIPVEEGAKLQYNADKLVAAVATQAFHYMIQTGLEYSYLTTGKAFVFLHIKIDDPTTLYYHVAVPDDEVDDNEAGFLYARTAISQVIVLCVMACRSVRRSHKWRKEAKKKLEKYDVDYENILRQIPESERKLTPPSAYKGRRDPSGRSSPVLTRARKKCLDDKLHESRNDRQDDPDASRDSGKPRRDISSAGNGNTTKERKDGGAKDNNERRDGGNNNNSSSSSSSVNGGKSIQSSYCTQRCLLGISRRLPLDGNCPNVLQHRRYGENHAISTLDFTSLVQKQLADDLDHNCEPLGIQGARGALFRITLAQYGYVFVGKGTVKAFVSDLKKEGAMYRQMAAIQGTAVPVYLGNVDLLEWYDLDLNVRILHMLLMSWGGDEVGTLGRLPWLHSEIQRTVAQVGLEGVNHLDIRSPNILWNREVKRVMLIDFERAGRIIGTQNGGFVARTAMQEVSPNRKRKRAESPKQRI